MQYRVKMLRQGRFTLPKELRDALGWTAGTKLGFEVQDGSILVRRAVDMIAEERNAAAKNEKK
jgi:AbrB family looped-hinge helix DNA binding protein